MIALPRRDKVQRFQTLSPMSPPAPTQALGARSHVRVTVPPGQTVYARLHPGARGVSVCRALVTDLSAGGLALSMTEGRHDQPRAGQEVTVELELDGTEAMVSGRVVRVFARGLSIAYPAEPRRDLLAIIARLAARRLDFVDGHRHAAGLTARLSHRRFSSAGILDLRVQVETPSWWQAVFLEYLISWSEGDGLETAIFGRSGVARDLVPRPALLQLGELIALHCRSALPAHAECFALIQRTVAGGV